MSKFFICMPLGVHLCFGHLCVPFYCPFNYSGHKQKHEAFNMKKFLPRIFCYIFFTSYLDFWFLTTRFIRHNFLILLKMFYYTASYISPTKQRYQVFNLNITPSSTYKWQLFVETSFHIELVCCLHAVYRFLM